MSHPTLPRRVPAASLERWLPWAVWAVSMVNALAYLDRGWFPHDLGSIAHPAERVLLGELPHRDFEDVYTGGLAFLNALGFRLLGESAMSARWVVLAAYSAWVPAVWAVARSFAAPWLAVGTTLLAAAWTLPMYAEGMPSWYNLFLATFSLLALLRYTSGGRRAWLFWAGAAAGASILFKVIGLYAVAAGLLGLAWLENAARPDAPGGAARSRDALYRWLVAGSSLGLAALLGSLVARAMGVGGLVRFGVPAVAAPLTLAWAARRATGVGSGERLGTLMQTAAPYVLGVLAALAPFLLLYAASGAIDDLYRGILVLPQRRLAQAAWGGLRGGIGGMALAASSVAFVALAPRAGSRAGRSLAVAATVVGTAAVVSSGVPRVYLALWQGLWWLPPFVTGAAVWALARSTSAWPGEHASKRRANGAYLALAAYGLSSLVEVPFAAPIYFFYAAPLLLLLALALSGAAATSTPLDDAAPAKRARGISRPAWLAGIMCLLLAFTVLRLDPGFVRYLGLQPAHDEQTEPLRIPRGGGLRVDAAACEEVETVVDMVERISAGPYVYATPDAPEIYVLTGKRNPTRTLFEFLDPEPETRVRRVLDALDRTGVNVVVINRRPLFSGPVDPELVAGLQARYPMAREAGRFLVVWKVADQQDGPAPPP